MIVPHASGCAKATARAREKRNHQFGKLAVSSWRTQAVWIVQCASSDGTLSRTVHTHLCAGLQAAETFLPKVLMIGPAAFATYIGGVTLN